MKTRLIIGIILLITGTITIVVKIMFFPQLTTEVSSDWDFLIIALGMIQMAIGIMLVGIHIQETQGDKNK